MQLTPSSTCGSYTSSSSTWTAMRMACWILQQLLQLGQRMGTLWVRWGARNAASSCLVGLQQQQQQQLTTQQQMQQGLTQCTLLPAHQRDCTPAWPAAMTMLATTSSSSSSSSSSSRRQQGLVGLMRVPLMLMSSRV
jgi:hypothetical protein